MRSLIGLGFVLAATMALPASAHHSYAMFDSQHPVDLKGTVKDWEWANPHTSMTLAVTDEQGKTVSWVLEGASPAVLRAHGWARNGFKEGDAVSVKIYPLRSGAKGGQLNSVTVAAGTTYTMANGAVKQTN